MELLKAPLKLEEYGELPGPDEAGIARAGSGVATICDPHCHPSPPVEPSEAAPPLRESGQEEQREQHRQQQQQQQQEKAEEKAELPRVGGRTGDAGDDTSDPAKPAASASAPAPPDAASSRDDDERARDYHTIHGTEPTLDSMLRRYWTRRATTSATETTRGSQPRTRTPKTRASSTSSPWVSLSARARSSRTGSPA